jgi:hypothetical protein
MGGCLAEGYCSTRMSGWLAIGLIVIGLLVVALAVLGFDMSRGDVGGGRHTMARARRLLVIATDEETGRAADLWVGEQRAGRPEMQCFVLVEPDGQELFMAVQSAIERESPDALVVIERETDQRDHHNVTIERIREQFMLPIDTVFANGGSEA